MDYKLFLSTIIYWCSTGSDFGMKLTMPRIMANMGYTSSKAQLLTIHACVGAISAYAACRSSDHFRWCLPFIVVNVAFPYSSPSELNFGGSLGATLPLFCLALHSTNIAARTSNNLAGPAKSVTGIGFMLIIANTAGIIKSFIYMQPESPRHHLRQPSLPFPFVEDRAKFTVFCTIPTAAATRLLCLICRGTLAFGTWLLYMSDTQLQQKGESSRIMGYFDIKI